MQDIYFSYFILTVVGVAILGYLARTLMRGRKRNDRTDADGGSVFLNKASMEMGYWVLDPLYDALRALRITPNMVTAFSLVPAFGAGVAVAFGWFGLACVLATLASLCDLVDGVLARKLKLASNAGEVFDAAVDRYVEFFFLAGLLVYYRDHWMVMVLVLAAVLGAFMVSYSTAKAEAMSVPPPRGSMRRAERAVYLLVASGFTPFCKALFANSPSHALRELPIILAVTVVGVVSNVSAVRRMGAIVQVLRARAPQPLDSDSDDDAAMITKPDTPTGLV